LTLQHRPEVRPKRGEGDHLQDLEAVHAGGCRQGDQGPARDYPETRGCENHLQEAPVIPFEQVCFCQPIFTNISISILQLLLLFPLPPPPSLFVEMARSRERSRRSRSRSPDRGGDRGGDRDRDRDRDRRDKRRSKSRSRFSIPSPFLFPHSLSLSLS